MALFFFLYIAIRAFVIPITWDESYTLNEYLLKDILLLRKFDLMSANFHLLNVWLSWLVAKLLGFSTFVIRIPNIIAFLFYCLGVNKIVRLYIADYRSVLWSCLFIVNPFLLDFFGLCRGYGISFALLIWSIYFFLLFITGKKTIIYFFLASILIQLACLANLSMLYTCVSMNVLGVFILIRNKFTFHHSEKKLVFTWFVSSIAFLIYVVYNLINLKANGSLFYGGNTGFWFDTINSIVFKSFYGASYPNFVQLVIKIFFLSSSAFVVVSAIKEKGVPAIVLLAGATVLINILTSLFFDVKYLVDRTALFYYILFALVLFDLAKTMNNKAVEQVFLVGVVAMLVVNFFVSFNFEYYLLWK